MNALDQLTDRELSEVFAVEVAGWEIAHFNHPTYGRIGYKVQEELQDDVGWEFPGFATSADAVLPFLERMCFFTAGREPHLDGKPWYVAVAATEEEGQLNSGLAPTFARAACIALIKAKRAEATP